MASSRIIFVSLALLGIAMTKTMATDFLVGDENGWIFGVDQQAWATGKEFKVGDKLIFRYAVGRHNVIIVDEKGLQACVAAPGSITLTTGYDIVELTTPGTHSYICGVGQHCEAGKMKFSINVVA